MPEPAGPTAPAWDVDLQLGEHWFDLPLGSEEPITDLQPQIDDRLEREPGLVEHLHILLDMLENFTRDAEEEGAASAAARWEYPPDGPMTAATLYVFVTDRADAGPVDKEIGNLPTALAKRQKTDKGKRTVEVVQLPAGQAVRLRVMTRSRALEAAGGAHLLTEDIQYWLPIPGYADTLVLTFTTPNLGQAADLVAEFDWLAEQLRLKL